MRVPCCDDSPHFRAPVRVPERGNLARYHGRMRGRHPLDSRHCARFVRVQVRARPRPDDRGGHPRDGRVGGVCELQGTRAPQPHRFPRELDGNQPDCRRAFERGVSPGKSPDEGPRPYGGDRSCAKRGVCLRAQHPRHRGPSRWKLGHGGKPAFLGDRLAGGALAHCAPWCCLHWRTFLGQAADVRCLRVLSRRHRACARENGLHRARLCCALW